MPIPRIEPYPRGFGKSEKKKRYVYCVMVVTSGSLLNVFSSRDKAKTYCKQFTFTVVIRYQVL